MKISIIIPAYNAAPFLADTLQSVCAQTHEDWELVVVDDGSQDGTGEVARDWAARDRRIRVVRQTNGGVAAARNRGFTEADPTTGAVIFLDHDDVWMPDALELLSGALASRPAAVAAHGLARKVGEGTDQIMDRHRRKLTGCRTVSCDLADPTTFDVLIYDTCLCTTGLILIRRAVLAGMGMALFDPAVAPSDDWDLWVRLSVRGDIAFVDRVVLEWRQHGGNVSRQRRVMQAASARSRLKFLSLPELSPAQRRLAWRRYHRMFISVERHNAEDCWRQGLRALTSGRVTDAACDMARAIGRYGRYLALRLFWRDRRDRGPIPLRLAETGGQN